MLLSLPLILVLGVFLPILGWLNLRHSQALQGADTNVPTTKEIVVQIFILQTIVGGLVLLAVHGSQLEVVWLPVLSIQTILVAVSVLLVVVLISLSEARKPLGPNEHIRARLREMSAKNPAWIGVTIYAGFIEEFAYRAVLTLLFAEAIGYWPAAIVSALLFGMAHLSSGLRALPASIFFALAMQLLVFVSGGLLLAVVVHIAYDLIAAWLGRRMAHASKSDGSSVL